MTGGSNNQIIKKLQDNIDYLERVNNILYKYLHEIEHHLIKDGTIYMDTGSGLNWMRLVVEEIKKRYKPQN